MYLASLWSLHEFEFAVDVIEVLVEGCKFGKTYTSDYLMLIFCGVGSILGIMLSSIYLLVAIR